jgi:hypothetical protein
MKTRHGQTKSRTGAKLTALLLVALAWGAGSSQAQKVSVREALEERRKQAKETPEQGTGSETEKFSVESARMYSQLLSFKYEPSQRDPFISSTVVSTLVTEEESVEATGNVEEVNAAKAAILNVAKGKIKVGGIAFSRRGTSYMIAYTDGQTPQIVGAGDYLAVELSGEEQAMVDNAYKAAVAAGVKLNVSVASDRPALIMEILKIEGSLIDIQDPTGDGKFTITYTKDMELGMPEKARPKK